MAADSCRVCIGVAYLRRARGLVTLNSPECSVLDGLGPVVKRRDHLRRHTPQHETGARQPSAGTQHETGTYRPSAAQQVLQGPQAVRPVPLGVCCSGTRGASSTAHLQAAAEGLLPDSHIACQHIRGPLVSMGSCLQLVVTHGRQTTQHLLQQQACCDSTKCTAEQGRVTAACRDTRLQMHASLHGCHDRQSDTRKPHTSTKIRPDQLRPC